MATDQNGVSIQPEIIEKLKRYQSARINAMRDAPTGTPLPMSPQGNVGVQPFKLGGPVHPLSESARRLAAQGRNGDDAVLHVNRKELSGLASILRKPLTTNPHTGMPEAFGWQDILPMAAAAAATYFTGGAASPLMTAAAAGGAAGGTRMLMGGSLQDGLMTGLMAGGGAGLASSLGAAGDAATAAPAASAMDVPPPVEAPVDIPAAHPEAGAAMEAPAGPGVAYDTGANLKGNPDLFKRGITSVDNMMTGAQQPGMWTTMGKDKALPYAAALGIGALGSANNNASPAATPLPASNWRPMDKYNRRTSFPTSYSNSGGEYNYFPMAEGGTVPDLPMQGSGSNPLFAGPDGNGSNLDEMNFVNRFAAGGIATLDNGGDASVIRALRRNYPSRAEAEAAAMKKGSFAQKVGVTPDSPLLDYAYGPRKDPRMISGPGDGLSDSVPASINGNEPAALAEGEFVVPADVVSHLGNGSTKAGADYLYKVMDDVREKRTGTKKQGKQIDPSKLLAA